MNLRHLRFFATLAREQHFGRAAAACNVTQPTLSEAIRQLERELRVLLINRSRHRFHGLTAEGERVLSWVQRMLADQSSMEQELSQFKGALTGALRFGVIPTALPVAPFLTVPFCNQNPLVIPRLLSMTSVEIQQGIESGDLDAGVTYLENEPLRNVQTFPLYREHYMLLTPANDELERKHTMTWKEAGRLSMCLLTTDMQNRRIIDRLFSKGGVRKVRVAAETNSILSQIAHARMSGWSSIVPHTSLALLETHDVSLKGMRVIPLTEPLETQSIGLVVSEREPLSPIARALVDIASRTDISGSLDRLYLDVFNRVSR